MASGGGRISFDFKGVAPDRLTPSTGYQATMNMHRLDLMDYEEKRPESWKKVCVCGGVNLEGMRGERMGYEYNQNVLCDILK